MPPVPISFDLLRVDLGLRQQAPQHLQMLLPARNEQGIDGRAFRFRRRDRRADLAQRLQHGIGRAMGIGLERDDGAAVAGSTALAEYRLDELAEGILGDEGGVAALALARSVARRRARPPARAGSSADTRRCRPPGGRWRRRSTGTSALRATGATAATDFANSGPMIRVAPLLSASSAAALAPSGVPLSSLTISCRLGLSRSNSASSAACLRLLPITPGWPCAESGTSTATLTSGRSLPWSGLSEPVCASGPPVGAGANQHGAEQPSGKAAGSQRSAGTD